MTILARLDDAGFIDLTRGQPDAEGPPEPAPDGWVVLNAPLRFGDGPSPTSRPRPDGSGGVLWIEMATLAATQARAIATIDAVADKARAQILAFPTNPEEYRPAAADATAYRDAGFTGPVPRGVAGWAYAKRRKGWTAQDAAEDILATAQRWTDALWFIRDHRLDVKELVRDATTTHEANLLLEVFVDGLTAAMQGVQ